MRPKMHSLDAERAFSELVELFVAFTAVPASVHAAVSDEHAAALNAQFVPATLSVQIGVRQFVVSFEPERVSLRADSSGSTTEVRILLTSPEGHRFAPGEELRLLAGYLYKDALKDGEPTQDALNDTDLEGVTISALGISETLGWIG